MRRNVGGAAESASRVALAIPSRSDPVSQFGRSKHRLFFTVVYYHCDHPFFLEKGLPCFFPLFENFLDSRLARLFFDPPGSIHLQQLFWKKKKKKGRLSLRIPSEKGPQTSTLSRCTRVDAKRGIGSRLVWNGTSFPLVIRGFCARKSRVPRRAKQINCL